MTTIAASRDDCSSALHLQGIEGRLLHVDSMCGSFVLGLPEWQWVNHVAQIKPSLYSKEPDAVPGLCWPCGNAYPADGGSGQRQSCRSALIPSSRVGFYDPHFVFQPF
ncbi:hypothetical protein [Paenibacillus sp. V4I7]|uniref:hypothetical protein n=1 Tax=Paenibacillus sp. V4I7 TaxID=3042307 RepID=UPI002789865B|nr:hypothetical protein [Paenibacillus sp. V4I7]MDQ0901129.1 hypothetical protein [Paenibacillus sp. V4I7]